jgi:2-C-methyl-D-erythritol 4-phosphate cytidylyltransferase
MNKFTAIVLAAGSGKRMQQETPKQYMNLGGVPLMVHCLRTFQESQVTQIVLVVAPGDIEKCRTEIIERYHIDKCIAIVEGGEERYNSVYAGLQAIDDGYVLIHDCARAFVTTDIIHRCMSAVALYESCVLGMPTK